MNFKLKNFQKNLMSWYKKYARDLPWRRTKNPYYIWLSEVMLQQTQVKTVIPYYEKFIQTFPTLKDLAYAPEDKLMQYWQGLGYYRRAKHLHQAAKQIIAEHNGHLPKTAQELIKLKGFGEYTSASVASIAFGQAIACVDGNVKRVMARLFADDTNPAEKSQSLLYEKNPGDYNQAIMELGATVCTPKNPQCLLCPVQTFCCAQQQGQVDLFPKKTKKIKQTHIYAAIVLIEHKDCFLMEKRTQAGRWENLWQNPSLESKQLLSSKIIKQWLEDLTGKITVNLCPIAHITHQLTHQKISAQILHLNLESTLKSKDLHSQSYQWVKKEDLSTLGISTFQKKAFQQLNLIF
ncbi:MAG TPA: A/G-specific adenine glycosylase [Oligoflexia bacterium]|nr:A/G-specific adenine glycosylase [Oligoflexia bacterium]HMR24961.1 A/G-specific adenine glycosylase [Oligoflexia bacterium]